MSGKVKEGRGVGEGKKEMKAKRGNMAMSLFPFGASVQLSFPLNLHHPSQDTGSEESFGGMQSYAARSRDPTMQHEQGGWMDGVRGRGGL